MQSVRLCTYPAGQPAWANCHEGSRHPAENKGLYRVFLANLPLLFLTLTWP